MWTCTSTQHYTCSNISLRHKAKRRVLVDHSSVVCQSLRVAVKRELIHLPVRKDRTKGNNNIISEQKSSTPSPDSSSNSQVASLPISIPHSTSSDDGNLLATVDIISQHIVSDKQVLPDSTSTIPLCIPPTISSVSPPSPDASTMVDHVSTSGDVSTTTTTDIAHDLLATPPRMHPSASPDHKRIRRSPRNLSLHSAQQVMSLKPESCDPEESGSEMITCALCKICVHKCKYCVYLYKINYK